MTQNLTMLDLLKKYQQEQVTIFVHLKSMASTTYSTAGACIGKVIEVPENENGIAYIRDDDPACLWTKIHHYFKVSEIQDIEYMES